MTECVLRAIVFLMWLGFAPRSMLHHHVDRGGSRATCGRVRKPWSVTCYRVVALWTRVASRASLCLTLALAMPNTSVKEVCSQLGVCGFRPPALCRFDSAPFLWCLDEHSNSSWRSPKRASERRRDRSGSSDVQGQYDQKISTNACEGKWDACFPVLATPANALTPVRCQFGPRSLRKKH